jgi:hypothetical protein
MPPPKPLLKEQILLAMRHTKSNRAAARYLNVSYIHYKMWAKRYHEFEGGRTLFEVHYNQKGVGIAKWGNIRKKKSKWGVLDVVEGRISHTHFKPEEIKKRMIEEGILKEECEICSFHERRVNDYKIPLILNFKDNNPNHYNLGNIRFLCYNCYFLNIGNVFNNKDIHQLETHTPVNGTTDAIEFELDEYQMEQLKKLGLYEPPKFEDDGSEFISRI